MPAYRCRSCGAAICWITTVAGKMMPCDGKMFYGKAPGPNTLVTRDGRVVRCTIADEKDYDVTCWVPHFITCPNADSHRKRPGKKPIVQKRPKPYTKTTETRQMNMFEMMR